MFPLDYFWKTLQETISKLPLPYQVLLTLIVAVLVLYCALNRKIFDKWVESHRENSNRMLKITLSILILCLVAFFTVDNFYSPKPPEDQLVVAISPFCFIDEYGKTGSDINTATDFKERIEAEKDLGIKVIILEDPIRDIGDAKCQGKKVGAHLVVYGETKKKIGNIGEVKYYILPLLSSLEVIPSEMPFLEVRAEEENSLIITEKATFSMVTEEPITIIESLKENASSAIYVLGAFKNYKKLNFTSAITFFKSIKNYENCSSILFYIASCNYFNNNSNECLLCLDKAIGINPQDAKAWYNKGFVLSGLDRCEEAIAAYNKAIEINPQLATAWNNKGATFCKLGRYEEAIAAYDKAIEI
ncbi:hypothetical protein C5S32_02250, partial [ANME-1 cluster archaeon GoMg1]|nr:hypothetical protein [ANME-1 cluster archaeon GoMg1]